MCLCHKIINGSLVDSRQARLHQYHLPACYSLIHASDARSGLFGWRYAGGLQPFYEGELDHNLEHVDLVFSAMQSLLLIMMRGCALTTLHGAAYGDAKVTIQH